MSEVLKNVMSLYPSRPKSAILMSGSGSNAINLLTNSHLRDLYDFTTVVTDNEHSNAGSIAQANNLDYIEMHQDRFYSSVERHQYFDSLAHKLAQRGITAAIYAGFMKITSDKFASTFPGVNVHPADLTVTGPDGIALHRGMEALTTMRAQTGGLIAASVHVVDNPVDTGAVIAVSNSITCPATYSDKDCHELLKHREHVIYPKALIGLAEKTISLNTVPIREEDL